MKHLSALIFALAATPSFAASASGDQPQDILARIGTEQTNIYALQSILKTGLSAPFGESFVPLPPSGVDPHLTAQLISYLRDLQRDEAELASLVPDAVVPER